MLSTTKIYDRESGGAEHCQMGYPTLWHADLFDWLSERFESREVSFCGSFGKTIPA